MTAKNKFKYIFIAVALVVAGLALADSLGYFNEKPYTRVSHGAHDHFVPHDRDPDVSIDKFPQEEPRPSEMITPTGQIVNKDEWEQSNEN